jgi:hypothetical protein
MQQSSRVIILYVLILDFLAKEKKRVMKSTQEKKTNTTKDFKILMYVTMRIVRLCNIENRHQ